MAIEDVPDTMLAAQVVEVPLLPTTYYLSQI